jgi:hypothetical protein
MRNVLRAVVTAALLGASGWMAAVPAQADQPAASDLPSSLHGAVETQGLTIGNGAAALLVDPGTAYAYSTLDRDDYGGGSVSFTMTARGANLNLGTIPLAVIWAAPSCTPAEGDPVSTDVPCALSGGTVPGVTPNTGLHEAKGFPAYAEALYPPPPADSGQLPQDRVYKCVVNKDGPGAQPSLGRLATICKQSDGIPLTSWAEAIGDEVRTTGFSRAAGFDAGTVKVAGSESFSQVQPIEGGKLISQGYSVIKDVSLLGGQITFDSIRSAARIVSAASGESQRDVSCTFSGLKIAGQDVKSDGNDLPIDQMAPLLQGISDSTGYVVEIVKPGLVSKLIEGSQDYAACSGIQVKITDTHTQAPVPVCLPAQVDPSVPQCVPALANREEFSFGRIVVQQSVNNATAFNADTVDALGAVGDATGGGTDVLGADLSASGGGADLGLGVGGSGLSGGAQSGSGSLANGAGTGTINGNLSGSVKLVNSGQLGVLAAVSALAWLVAILVAVGTINSLATGRPLRLPGF